MHRLDIITAQVGRDPDLVVHTGQNVRCVVTSHGVREDRVRFAGRHRKFQLGVKRPSVSGAVSNRPADLRVRAIHKLHILRRRLVLGDGDGHRHRQVAIVVEGSVGRADQHIGDLIEAARVSHVGSAAGIDDHTFDRLLLGIGHVAFQRATGPAQRRSQVYGCQGVDLAPSGRVVGLVARPLAPAIRCVGDWNRGCL